MYRASTYIPALVTGQTLPINFRACPNLKAALLLLCQMNPKYIDHLVALSPPEWRKLLGWLDANGLSLYFADRVNELNLQAALPPGVNERLQQNLSDNRARMRSLLQECAQLQSEFQSADLSYAVLEGFSLCPSPVPMAELRHQLDLEFLVDENDASKAREILEQAGYRLHGIGERTWEFKKNETASFSKKNMYQDLSARAVELHIEVALPGRKSVLSRVEHREIEGVMMPVLAPADLFLRQGMHAFEDVCSSSLRAAHLLEFYRNVCAHAEDRAFWTQVRELAEEEAIASFGLGVILQLVEAVMEEDVPSKLAMWTTLRLPATAQRWVDLHGLNCVYGTSRGTKLYLMLRRELEKRGISFSRPARTAILPPRLRQVILPASAGDPMSFRIRRQMQQFRFAVQRLRFQFVEGLSNGWAFYRWQRFRNGLSA